MPIERSTVPSLLLNMVVDDLFYRLYNSHYQAQVYVDHVVWLQKGKLVRKYAL
jgi:hypothetical protein